MNNMNNNSHFNLRDIIKYNYNIYIKRICIYNIILQNMLKKLWLNFLLKNLLFKI